MKYADELSLVNHFMETAPVDVEGLARALGVRVRRAWLDGQLSGMIERNTDGKYVITVNASDRHERQRFTIAHELGHYMLHRSLIGDGVDDDRAYRSTSGGKYHNLNIGPRQETEANRFAANLLMPRELISKLKRDRGLRTTDDLATALAVSKQAMAIREGRAA